MYKFACLLRFSDPAGKSVPAAVENIADAVTHAKFVGTDQTNDGVVLMKILQVGVFNFKDHYSFSYFCVYSRPSSYSTSLFRRNTMDQKMVTVHGTPCMIPSRNCNQ
jgi:hypothetical protein